MASVIVRVIALVKDASGRKRTKTDETTTTRELAEFERVGEYQRADENGRRVIRVNPCIDLTGADSRFVGCRPLSDPFVRQRAESTVLLTNLGRSARQTARRVKVRRDEVSRSFAVRIVTRQVADLILGQVEFLADHGH